MGMRPALHDMYMYCADTHRARSSPAINRNPTKCLFFKNFARVEAKERTSSSVDALHSCLERLGGVGGADGKAGVGIESKRGS